MSRVKKQQLQKSYIKPQFKSTYELQAIVL